MKKNKSYQKCFKILLLLIVLIISFVFVASQESNINNDVPLVDKIVNLFSGIYSFFFGPIEKTGMAGDIGDSCVNNSDCNSNNCQDGICAAAQPVCGNNIIEAEEQCDNGNANTNTPDLNCYGQLTYCNTNCSQLTANCNRYCGDGIINSEDGEVCDGTDLARQDCTTQGFDSGNLACSPNCQSFDISNCVEAPSINKTSSISQFNITWYFDKEYEYGTFANGDYWVVGPVNITRIEPESIIGDGTKTTITSGGNWIVQNGRTVHGSMIDPVGSGDEHIDNKQGFDSSLAVWSSATNVGRPNGNTINAENPLVIGSNHSLISSKSSASAGYRITDAAVLTILGSAPDVNSFRPGYMGSDKTIKYNVSNLDWSNIQSLAPVAGAPSLATAEGYFERPWISWQRSFSDIHPSNSMPDYGPLCAVRIGDGMLVLNLNYTNAQKKTLMIRLIQLGIDYYGVLVNGGRVTWIGAGGAANTGHKLPVVFAATVLNDSNMKALLAKTGDYLYSDGYHAGHQPPDYYELSEDSQTFYVSAEEPYSDIYKQPYELKYGDVTTGAGSITGRVKVMNGSNIVTGVNTNWNTITYGPNDYLDGYKLKMFSVKNDTEAYLAVREVYKLVGPETWYIPHYTVKSIDSDTQITLTYPYVGNTDQTGNAEYAIAHHVWYGHGPDKYPIDPEEYTSKHLGMPEWGGGHSQFPYTDGANWNTGYRHVAGKAFGSISLPALIMDLKTVWNHNALFDYTDRYMEIEAGETWRSESDFAENMWDAYRADYGCVWTRNNQSDIYSKGHYNCSNCLYNCLQSPYCGDGNCNGGENSSSCSYDCVEAPICGNNIKESGEICDGIDLAGQNCITQGFDSGSLACLANCSGFDTSGCVEIINNPPNATTFDGSTTNFAAEPEINNVPNAILEKTTYGKINFSGQTLNFANLDLDKFVVIEDNKIGIDENNLPNLNVPAILTIIGSFTNPKILEDGVLCYTGVTHCNIIEHTANEVKFTVDHFSNFSVMDGCLNDTGCFSVGIFCDGNIPYTCSVGGDGCLDRVNGNDCSLDGKICYNENCVIDVCSDINSCSGYTDESNCTTDSCGVGICKWNSTSGVCYNYTGNVYYVSQLDSNCNDNGNGTSEEPWCNLSRSYTWYSGTEPKVQAGDTVLFRNGSYGDYYEKSIERTDWITYKAEEGHSPEFAIIDINWNGPDSNTYLKFDGITIRPELDDKYAISVRHSNHTQFLNLNVIGQGARYTGKGFYARYINYVTLDNSIFSGETEQGRYDGFDDVSYFRDATNIIVTNNELRQFKGIGVVLPSSDSIVSNNSIHKFGGDGIIFGSGSGNLLIENNKIHDIQVYYPELQETPTETTWSVDGTTMYNPNANWGSADEPFHWAANIEIVVISGNNVNTGDNEIRVAQVVSPTEIVFDGSIGSIPGITPSNVDYYLRDQVHADLIQASAGNGTYFNNITIKGNELYDSISGWACMHLQAQDYDNPDLNIGGSNWLVENNLCWNSYANGQEENGAPLNLRHIDGAIFRNNTVIGRVQLRYNHNVNFTNNIISFIDVYGTAGLVDNDYNIFNRGGFSSNYSLGPNTIFLYPGINEDQWNDPAFTEIFADYYAEDFRPITSSIACNGSINPPGIAVGALPCVCTNNSQCEEVFGSNYICENEKCVETPIVKADYYVDGNLQNDCNGTYSIVKRDCSGTDGIAYNTIQEAANVVKAGETVLVRVGTYNETLAPKNSGTLINLITFKVYPGEGCHGAYGGTKSNCQVVLDGENTRHIAAYLYPHSYIRIEGFEIRNYTWYETIYVGDYYETQLIEGIEIVNNYIHDNAGFGVYVRGKFNKNILIENNEIFRNGGSGVIISADGAIIKGNNIHYNGKDGIEGGGNNFLIEDNKLYNQFHTEQHQDGLDIGSLSNSVIRNNVIFDFTQLIYLAEVIGPFYLENIDIYGNILYTDKYYTEKRGIAPGIFIGADDPRTNGSVISNISIHSNTFGWTGISGVQIYVNPNWDVGPIKLRNNIFYDAGFARTIGLESNIISDYNLFYGVGKPSFEGQHSIVGQNPLFVNYTRHVSHDFHLQETSPVINAGDPNLANIFKLPNPFVDIDGNIRPQGSGYDIGAYEYVPQSCTNDTGCLSVGSFCQGSMPFNCSLNISDGCLDRINETVCGSGYYCSSGKCLQGNVYYVSVSGAGNHDGSLGNEMNLSDTQKFANLNLGKEITFLLSSGNYGVFSLTNVPNRTSWVTYKADEGHTPVFTKILVDNSIQRDAYLRFDGLKVQHPAPDPLPPDDGVPKGTLLGDTIYIRRANYVDVRNSTLVGFNKYLSWVPIELVNSNNVTIHHNDMHTFVGGVRLENSQAVDITYNHIHDISEGTGLRVLTGNSDILLEGNHLHDQTEDRNDVWFPADRLNYVEDINGTLQVGENISQTPSGVIGRVKSIDEVNKRVYAVTLNADSGDFESNQIVTGQTSGATFTPTSDVEGHHTGSAIGLRSSNVIIRNNIVHHGWAQGLMFYGIGQPFHDITLENNLFYDTGSVALHDSGNNILVRNNTFIGKVAYEGTQKSQILSRYYVDTAFYFDSYSGYDGSGVTTYNNIIVSEYDSGSYNSTENYNLIHSNPAESQTGKGENTFMTVWMGAAPSYLLRGYPNFFEDIGFRGSTPEYDYSRDGIQPFFVNPGFYFKTVLREGKYSDKGKFWDYHPLMTSPVCNGGYAHGRKILDNAVPGVAWAGALPCVCTNNSQCEQVFGANYVCENEKCVESVSIQKTKQISQFNITWYFDKEYEYGIFANGDYWVKGPVTIINITPEYFYDGMYYHHGWQSNPMPGYPQGFDSRASTFDPKLVPSLPYNALPNESIVKSISIEPLENADCRPCLETAAVLTVVANTPPDNGATVFRPPYVGTQKPFYFVNQLRPELLPMLQPLPNTPSLETIKNNFQRVQLDHKLSWSGEYIRPKQNMASYGAGIAIRNAEGALRLMLNDSIQEKMPALINYAQAGIDLYAILKNGGSWGSAITGGGGHPHGRKLPIAFAAVLLNNQEMKDAVHNAGDNIFGENDGIKYSEKAGTLLYAEIGCSELVYWKKHADQLGIGPNAAGSKTCKDPYGYIDGGGNPGASYLGCCVSQNWKASSIAVRLMPELRAVWNDEEFHDFSDRYADFGRWTQPDPCAPITGDCNVTKVPCTSANREQVCRSDEHCETKTFDTDYGVKYGQDKTKPGECIKDTDPSDGIGRVPQSHGTNKNTGGWDSRFANEMWDRYRQTTLPQQCSGTDISCGSGTSCVNCNASDGCSGNEYRDYRCSGTNCIYTTDSCADCSCSCGGYNVPETIVNNNCNDGKDNDCEGNIDAADLGCICQTGVITNACYCDGTLRTSGYCCNGVYQTTACAAIALQFRHVTVDNKAPSSIDSKTFEDINKDGFLDLVIAGFSEIYWYEYPNWTKHRVDNASGQGGWSTDAETGDIDNDGDIDLVLSDYQNNRIVWFENTGSEPWQMHVIGSPSAHDIEVGDLDKDNRLDIVTRKPDMVIWKQNSPDSWTKKNIITLKGEGLHLGDLDQDNDKDIIIGGRWYENLGNISATWSEHIFSNTPSGNFPWMADIDNDGKPDVVLTPSEGSGKTTWHKAPADPKSSNWIEYIIDSSVETTHSIGVADFDKDGDIDVMTAEMHQSADPDEVRVYLNKNGSGTSWEKQVVNSNDSSITYGSHNARVLDVGNDGDYDIFGTDWGSSHIVDLWENLLYGLSLDNWTYIRVDNSRDPSPYQGFFGLAMGDLTNDSYGDIVSGKYFYRNPKGNMGGAWTRVTFPDSPASKPYDALLIGNIDNDSFGDIIAMDGTGKVYWLESEDISGSSWKSIQVGDMGRADHDISTQGYAWGDLVKGGRPEIIINVAGIYYLEIPANPEAGNWPQTKIAKSYFEGVCVGYIDKDGDLDVCGNAGGASYNTVAWWENPDNSTPDWVKYNVGSTPDKYADRFYTADVSGDGKLDFVVSAANGNHNGIYWFEQPADPKSSNWSRHTVVDYGSTNSMNSLDVADMDGDRDIDIISHTMSGRVAIWENSGAGNFIEHVVDSGKGGHLGARVSDLDNDGDLEIVSIEWTGLNLHLWRNDASYGVYPNCQSCNSLDGCSGDSYRDYYCSGTSCLYTIDDCSDCSCSCGGYNATESISNNNCLDEKDNDCDGNIDSQDSGCQCQQGQTQSCNTGLPGICSIGTQTCQSNGTWGNCIQNNQPSIEICNDSLDNDCDGQTDCRDSDCSSEPACQITFPTDYISYWKFEGNTNDEKGINNGTLMNGATIATDSQKGQVLILDGIDDYLDLGSNTSIDNIWDNGGTITLWVYPETLSITDQRIFSKGDEYVVSLVLNEGDGKIEFRTGPSPTATTIGISSQKWTHIAVTYDNTATLNGLKIYFNGQLQPINSVTPETIDDSSFNLIIGSDRGIRRYFNGTIDEVMIYNRALSESEILQIYNAQTHLESICDNNITETGEICDGTDLSGQDCITQRFDSGSLACLNNCSGFDTSGCTIIPVEICENLIDDDSDSYIDQCDANCNGNSNIQSRTTSPYYPTSEICDSYDNNCNGQTDEGLGQTTCGLGICLHTINNCVNGSLQTCNPFEGSTLEVCEGILDEDCDGAVDNGCSCTIGETRACGSDVGECQSGIETCVDGTWDGVCAGEITPTAEVCDNFDNDCNGLVDDANFGTTTCGFGICLHTINNCENGSIQICNPMQGSTAEVCDDNIDNNCDNLIDLDDIDCRNCTITSLSWSTLQAQQNDIATIMIYGQNCTGKLMNITIMERDALTPDDLINSTIEIPFTSELNWSAIYQKDEYSFPEYYFTIQIDGITYNLLDYVSADEMLHVTPIIRSYEQKTLYLNQGKNPFSIPLMLDNMSIEYIFKDMKDKAEKIYTYDDGWKIYYFDNKPSNLFELKPGIGYMLFMKEPAILTINGSILKPDLTTPTFNLREGWKLIGTFSTNRPAQNILQGVNYTELYTFNGSSYQPVQPDMQLNETGSYWIYVTKESIMIPVTGEPWGKPIYKRLLEQNE